MKTRPFAIAAIALAVPLAAAAQNTFTALHPERQYPDPPAESSYSPYNDFIAEVQRTLVRQGFDAGPPNGDFGTKTQAALAQFQLSHVLPASGQLDDETLAALGVRRPQPSSEASTGASAQPQSEPGAAPAAPPAEKPAS